MQRRERNFIEIEFNIRPAVEQDIPFLWESLYDSLFVPEGGAPFSRDIIHDPFLAKYVDGWGREGDLGLIAETADGKPVGSITARYYRDPNRGFGYVSDDVPELGMSVLQGYRGIGVGKALLGELIALLRRHEVRRLSLSVDPANEPAMRLYSKFGFRECGKVGTSVTMSADLRESEGRLSNDFM